MAEADPLKPKTSICLVVCYVGKLSSYIDCVFRSCECNPDISWLVLTDDRTPRRLPSNVHIKYATMDELREGFSKKLGFEVSIPNPHQLCNFKPAYGCLFADSLVGYDFWGHCDLDVIYGDLRAFLAEDILSSHNKVLNRGHLSLYRNTPEVNRYFMLKAPKVADYRDVFRAPRTDHAFDEWRGICPILRYHNIAQYQAEFIVDVKIPTRWKYTRFEGTEITNYSDQLFYWYKGKIFQAYRNREGGTIDHEYAYIHLQGRSFPPPGFDPYATDGFLITPDGFFPYAREYLTEEDYRKYNRARFRPGRELMRMACRSLRQRLGF
jgi:hypothetical protein